jgi:hypothetical protein
MDFKNWLFSEMPINKFELLGKWGKGRGDDPQPRFPFAQVDAKQKYGYRKDDIGILTSPVAVQKIKNQWLKTNHKFDFYFLRSPEGRKVVNVGEVGHDYLVKTLKLKEEDFPAEFDTITVIFTNNFAAERIPMTGWMIAHRLGHALTKTRGGQPNLQFNRKADSVMKEIGNLMVMAYGLQNYDKESSRKYLLQVLNSIGTFASARKNLIDRPFEFFHELFAQHLLEGQIRFNPFPDRVVNRYNWGNPDHRLSSSAGRREADERLIGVAKELDGFFDTFLDECMGRIYVM